MARSTDPRLRKVRKLAEIARDLRAGKDFPITRLTTLKSLCSDPKSAARFALFLAEWTWDGMQSGRRPNWIEADQWDEYRRLAGEAIDGMRRYLRRRSARTESQLRSLLRKLAGMQSTYEYQKWGPVRIVESSQALLVEKALRCVLDPSQSSYWGYHVARQYTERYDSKYGTGLIPESAPMVEEIAEFWCWHLFRRSLREQFGAL